MKGCVCIIAVALAMLISACSRDEVIPALALPEIVLSSDDNTYTGVTDREIVVAPLFRYLDGGEVEWVTDGSVVERGSVLRFTSSAPGSYYFTLRATNSSGTTEVDIRINVVKPSAPVIELRVPQGGYRVQTGREITFEPTLLNADQDDFTIVWSVDEREVSSERQYTFKSDEAGVFHLAVKASNTDGVTSLKFVVTVTDGSPGTLHFPGLSYGYRSSTRYTFPGRAVCLSIVAEGFSPSSYSWSVNGEPQGDSGPMLVFTPGAPGSYDITVITPEGIMATAEVVCVDSDEASRRRHGPAGGNGFKVFEYTPAPGQFINDGDQAQLTDSLEAARWAQDALAGGRAVSLGAFGGCLIAGFDYSVAAGNPDWDFAVSGNQFESAQGSSCEPGVVWVMQDVNGNGLPDDEWYELRGSEWSSASPTADYAVTYYRPSAGELPVMWSDNGGAEGEVAYLGVNHAQPSYYPSWLRAEVYTLRGRLLPPHHTQDPVTGFWSNAADGWGYVDNTGSDLLPGGVANGFKISNAVMADGSPVALDYIDFVKIQSAVLGQSGILGEISTEVTAIKAR